MSKGFFQSKIFTVIALVVIFFLAFSLFRIRPDKVAVDRYLQNLENKIDETKKTNSDLARLLDYFKSRSYLEREAKLKLNVRRPDENVVFIFQDEKENNVKEEKNRGFSGLEELTNFEKWLRYLFK